jgi:signal peptidase I
MGEEYLNKQEIKELCYFLKREYLMDTKFVVPQSPYKEIDQTKEKYSHYPRRYFKDKKTRSIDVKGEVVELNNTYKTCTAFQHKVKSLFKVNKNKITAPQLKELFVEFGVDVVSGRMLKKMLSEILDVGIDSYEVSKSAERYYVYTKQK